MRDAPRRLHDDDVLYRVLAPDQYDDRGPLPGGFQDTGKTKAGEVSDTLSFWAAHPVTPRAALAKLSMRARVRRDCGTGREPPSPALMYEKGYRVAVISAEHVIAACAQPSTPLKLMADEQGDEVDPEGHVEVFDGHELAPTWARLSRILSGEETLAE